METENKQEKTETQQDQDDLMKMISQSIKTMAAMAQVGVSFCIVIPGYGVREDARLASNYITRKDDRSERDIIGEICGNISTILEAFMKSLLAQGVSDDAIAGIVDEIVSITKERYTVSTAGIGRGAGPQ